MSFFFDPLRIIQKYDRSLQQWEPLIPKSLALSKIIVEDICKQRILTSLVSSRIRGFFLLLAKPYIIFHSSRFKLLMVDSIQSIRARTNEEGFVAWSGWLSWWPWLQTGPSLYRYWLKPTYKLKFYPRTLNSRVKIPYYTTDTVYACSKGFYGRRKRRKKNLFNLWSTSNI